MQNRTCLVLCVFALLMGFLMICLGAFFISSASLFNCQGNLTLAYLLLPLGFVILLSVTAAVCCCVPTLQVV